MSLPALAGLRTALPATHLTVLVGPWAREVAERARLADEVATLPFPGFTRGRPRSPLAPYRLLWRSARQLARADFDAALLLRPDHWWGAWLAAEAGIPVRVGGLSAETAPFLTHSLRLPPQLHIADEAWALVSALLQLVGVPVPSPAWPGFPTTPDEDARAWEVAARLPRPLVVLHPGSGAALKLVPASTWAAVVDALHRHGVAVALAAGAGERSLQAEVARLASASPALLPALSLGELAALLRHADLVLGVDSGPLHLATALGRPTVRCYGPTSPSRFGPWGPGGPHAVVTVDLPCRPCGNLERPPCGARGSPPCLLRISARQITDAALTLLGQGAGVAPR